MLLQSPHVLGAGFIPKEDWIYDIDADDYTTQGTYMIGRGTNVPVNWGTLIVYKIQRSGNGILQFYASTVRSLYYRIYGNNGWGDWKEL